MNTTKENAKQRKNTTTKELKQRKMWTCNAEKVKPVVITQAHTNIYKYTQVNEGDNHNGS